MEGVYEMSELLPCSVEKIRLDDKGLISWVREQCPNRTAPDWEALAREVEDSGIGDNWTRERIAELIRRKAGK